MAVSPGVLFCAALLRLTYRPRCVHRCLTDLADECAVNNGGCWQGQYMVKGSKQTFSACKDQLQTVKVRAGRSSARCWKSERLSHAGE